MLGGRSKSREWEDMLEYYKNLGKGEWERLEPPSIGAVEFAVTCHLLQAYLPPSGSVLDLGGGPGRYAIWLEERGYQVVLADASPEMLHLARIKLEEVGVSEEKIEILQADARELGILSDASFDAVLCLGPFYHLIEEQDRKRASRELVRVLRPGGLAFIAVMPRYTFLRRTLFLPDERHRILQPEWIQQLLDRGIFQNDVPGRFTSGYGFELSRVAPFFEGYGLETLGMFALEGFTAGLEATLAEFHTNEPELYAATLRLILKSAQDPSILGMSLHVLYVGQRKRNSF